MRYQVSGIRADDASSLAVEVGVQQRTVQQRTVQQRTVQQCIAHGNASLCAVCSIQPSPYTLLTQSVNSCR